MKAFFCSLFFLPVIALGEAREVTDSVARLDKVIASALASKGVTMNSRAEDSIWVRRAYLDLIGRIPTADEAVRYIDSNELGKRDALIVELLDSAGRVSHDFSYWADVLRVPSRVPGQNGRAVMELYSNWLREQFSKNTPYDELVTSLVTAEGFAGENPAVGFTLRDRGMPLDHMSATVETFLGTQMLCAQCHDHPFAEWTQRDFYGLAAFSYGVKDVRAPSGVEGKLREVVRATPRGKRRKLGRQMRLLFAPLKDALVEEVSRELKLPDDYQYDDGAPGDVILPEVPFGPEVALETGGSRVQAYAEWMTSPENPRFAKVGANRLWKRLFGVGVLEPVTDFDREDEAFSGELLDALSDLFVSLKYDMRAFTRVLANTDLYSRSAMPIADNSDFLFEGPVLRRMTAEQVWDSMVTLVQRDPDSVRLIDARGGGAELLDSKTYRRIQELEGEEIEQKLRGLSRLTRTSVEELEPIRKKVEALIEGKRSGDVIASDKVNQVATELSKYTEGVFREFAELAMIDGVSDVAGINNPLVNGSRQLTKVLVKDFPEARRMVMHLFPQYQKNKGRNEELIARRKLRLKLREIRQSEGAEAANVYLEEKLEERAQRANRRFVRAAWLQQPAPEGHFLRTFGQSDREASMNGSEEATVPQALALMNGNVFPSLLNSAAKMRRVLDEAPSASAKAEAVYLAILGRRPSAEEEALVMERLGSGEPKAVEGVLWALMNSPQFFFIE